MNKFTIMYAGRYYNCRTKEETLNVLRGLASEAGVGTDEFAEAYCDIYQEVDTGVLKSCNVIFIIPFKYDLRDLVYAKIDPKTETFDSNQRFEVRNRMIEDDKATYELWPLGYNYDDTYTVSEDATDRYKPFE